MEAAINSIFQDLKRSHLDMSGILAAEWWAHMREPTSAHQLHFDLDESRIGIGAAKYRLLHPVPALPPMHTSTSENRVPGCTPPKPCLAVPSPERSERPSPSKLLTSCQGPAMVLQGLPLCFSLVSTNSGGRC